MTEILYKVTDQRYKTRNDTQWGVNVTHGPTSGKGDLCSSGWLHAYKTAKDAALMHKSHVDFENPVLWQAEGTVEKESSDLKIGTTVLKTVRIIDFPQITAEDIDLYLDHKDCWEVRYYAIQHPNASIQQIDKALNDGDIRIRETAIRHPNATREHIDKALNDKYWDVRVAAIEHPNASSQQIDKGLDDKERYVRVAAIRHPNASSQNIDKGLNDKD